MMHNTTTIPTVANAATIGRSAAAQNAAHRADLLWAKVGRSEYLRSDGATISKDDATGRWVIYTPAGERFASAHSLTWAKIDAEEIPA